MKHSKVSVSLEELEMLYDYIQAVSGTLECTDLSRIFLLNEKTIKKHIIPIKKLIYFSPEYSEYSKLKYSCALTYADKDEHNNSIVEDRDRFGIIFRIIEKEKEYNKEMDKLDEKYIDCIKEWESQEKKYKEKIKEIINIELVQINFEDLPKNLNFNELKQIKILVHNIES